MKTTIIFTIIFAVLPLGISVGEVCKNNNIWCHYMVRYGACNFNNETKETCPRSCGICTVSCPNIKDEKRVECGYFGITQQNCFHAGCCWGPLDQNSKYPWCYKPETDQNEDSNSDSSCEDTNDFCIYHTRYGACNFNEFTQKNCRKSCNLC